MFFDSWSDMLRVVVLATLGYLALVLLLRVSGKRTLAKMNAFDLVVTVAIGSTLASVILSRDVALAEGVLAFAMLFLLQFVITWLSVRSSTVNRLVKAEPTMLFFRGEFLQGALQQQRVTESEILQAMRSQGVASPAQVEAVVLETDGTFSIVKRAEQDERSTLSDVSGREAR